jgi:hypothetical protein
MHKHFVRFSCSSPGGFGGGNDAPSPLVVVGDEAYFTTYGHVYALTYQRPTPIIDYGTLDLTGPPTTTLTREGARAMLNDQVQAIVNDNRHIGPASRLWGWSSTGQLGTFWHRGEVVRTLAEAIPYLDAPVRRGLAAYLKREVEDYLLNPHYYEYRWACIDYDSGTIEDPCDRNGVEAGWYWNNPNLTSERLYALYKYATFTGDSETIAANWAFIREQYERLTENWDEEAKFFIFPEWLAGAFNANLQMGAMLAVREMADRADDLATRDAASARLNRMLEARVDWGRYVRSLYDTGQLQRRTFESPESWGYEPFVSPVPAEGYLDKDNDYRQLYSLQRDEAGNLRVGFEDYRYLVYPYYLIGYHPIYPEFSELIRDDLADELADYLAAIEAIWPWWYMNDYGHGVITYGHEEESTSPLVASDIFQVRAYIYNETFEALAPYLPWPFEDYGHQDIFRLQNLVALLQAP